MLHDLIETLFNFDRRTRWAGVIVLSLILLSLVTLAIIK